MQLTKISNIKRRGQVQLFSSNRGGLGSVITLDELMSQPIYDKSQADPDTMQQLAGFPVPILPDQISESLRREFSRPIVTRTNWQLFWERRNKSCKDIQGDWYRAGQLIMETLAVWRNRFNGIDSVSTGPLVINEEGIGLKESQSIARFPPSNSIIKPQRFADLDAVNRTAGSILAWVQQECQTLYEEAMTGKIDRFEGSDHLIPQEWKDKMSKGQLEYLGPALRAIGRVAGIHPDIKREMIHHVCSVIHASTK